MTGPELVRLDIGALIRRLACSRMSVTRWVRDGRLGPPVYLGSRRLWTLAQVEAFEAENLADAPPRAVLAATARARSHQKETVRVVARTASAPGERCTSLPLRAGGTR
jgi:hypothetical protein